jgi:hypothetical protein
MNPVQREIKYSSRADSGINLLGLGDVHFGNPGCDVPYFEKHIDWVADHPDTYMIGMGDMADCIEKQDKRFSWDGISKEFPTPQSQFRYLEEILKPIKDRIIVLLDGNHEIAYWNKFSHNYTDGLAYALGVPYSGIDCYIRLKFQRQSDGMKAPRTTDFDIYAHHGYASPRGVGGKVKTLIDLASIYPSASLILAGHTHAKGPVMPQVSTTFNDAFKPVRREINFVYTGSFLNGHVAGLKSYAEERAYAPLPLGAQFIHIEPERGDSAARLSFFTI